MMRSKFTFSAGIVLVFISLSAGVVRAENFQCNDQSSVDSEKEMVITNAFALNSPLARNGGPWHFSSLLRQMQPAAAGELQVSAMVEGFLATFAVDQTLLVNPVLPAGPENPSRQLAARLDFQAKIIEPWIKKSRELGLTAGLRLDFAPFKLIAIVNRSDSRDPENCQATAGEGRFVFAALNEPTDDPQNAPDSALLPFTLIFEYGLPTGQKNALAWANVWHHLGAYDCSSTDCSGFQGQLQAITDGFSRSNTSPGRPAGNSLNQIRSNEILSFPGEMREFQLKKNGAINQLVPVPVNRNPDPSFNRTPELAAFVFANQEDVLNERFMLPDSQKTFVARTLHRQKWVFPNTAGIPEDSFEQLRFLFSKNTCDGCHSHEHPRITNLDGVYHINPEGELSAYMIQEAIPKRAALFCQLLAQTSCTDNAALPVNFNRAGIH